MFESPTISRREALQGLAAGAFAVAGLGAAALPVRAAGKRMADLLAPQPAADAAILSLPFDPKGIDGLSEKVLGSHHQNNYGGAVKRLNAIRQKIRALPADAAPFELGSLKREELSAQNSAILHELYFGNLGGKGAPGGEIAELVKLQFGDLATWEQEFRKAALALGGGSGWVILAYDPFHKRLVNVWAWDHLHGLAGGVPLLVLDMYEHAYHMDYGANAKAYVDVFFKNVDWRAVNRRVAALM